MKAFGARLLIAVLIVASAAGCRNAGKRTAPKAGLTAVATLFPVYDFARVVGGGKVDVVMLLPPGVEAHTYEPLPTYFLMVRDADVFIFTGIRMEPWVSQMLDTVDARRLKIIDSSAGISLRPVDPEDAGHDLKTFGGDPHIWLDFANAQTMVDTIAKGFAEKDPANRDFYLNNAKRYKAQLLVLDEKYAAALKTCKKPTIVHGGHFAFGYLAARYHLKYTAALGLSPQAEPTPGKMAQMVKFMRENGIKTIFYEELINPNVAEALAREAGASLVEIHGAHNLTRQEYDKGATFLSIMEDNLEKLKTGLECNAGR